MSGVSVNFSVKDLQRLKQRGELQPGVQITKAGGLLRGRYVGEKNFVYGVDVQQVLQRLKRLHKIKNTWPTEVIHE
jgi:hypothetical protein